MMIECRGLETKFMPYGASWHCSSKIHDMSQQQDPGLPGGNWEDLLDIYWKNWEDDTRENQWNNFYNNP